MHFVGVARRGRQPGAWWHVAPHSAREPSKDSYVIYFNFSQHVGHEHEEGEGGRKKRRRRRQKEWETGRGTVMGAKFCGEGRETSYTHEGVRM